MKLIYCLIIGILIGCAGTIAFFTNNINRESTTEVDTAIVLYKNKVDSLEKEISKYESGLYPSMLSVQKAIYSDAVAALEIKRLQIAHWLTINHNASTHPLMPEGNIEQMKKKLQHWM